MTDVLKLWFFRDLSDDQRLKLFSLFGLPVDEIGKVHSRQSIALRHIMQKLIELVRVETSKPAETNERCQNCDGYNCDDGCAYPDPTPPAPNNRQVGVDRLARAFQAGFTSGNAAWETTPEHHKDQFREGVRSLIADFPETNVPLREQDRINAEEGAKAVSDLLDRLGDAADKSFVVFVAQLTDDSRQRLNAALAASQPTSNRAVGSEEAPNE